MYYHERFAKFKYYKIIGRLYKGLQWQNDTIKNNIFGFIERDQLFLGSIPGVLLFALIVSVPSDQFLGE